MKRPYVKPKIERVPIRPDQAVADICWAYAKNGKPFYYDVPGVGYAQIHAVAKGGCSSATDFTVEIFADRPMTSAQIAQAEQFILQHINESVALAGNKPSPFKGSDFSKSPSPDWS